MVERNNLKNGIVFIGAGNVATWLCIALFKSAYKIKSIYSKTEESARTLALKVESEYTINIESLPQNADLYIISVKDDAIKPLLKSIKIKAGIVVHTAGSISLDIFKNYFDNYGVFYPLQTFSKQRDVCFENIPLCIEAVNNNTEKKLLSIAENISQNVYLLDSEKRKILHLAAVFACNFVNYMYTVSSELLLQSGISFDILKPLILETCQKAMDNNPKDVQTGPAVRNDKKVINKHLELLKNNTDYKKIYSFVSENIYKQYNNTQNN